MSGPNQKQFVLADPKTVTDGSDTEKASTANALAAGVFSTAVFSLPERVTLLKAAPWALRAGGVGTMTSRYKPPIAKAISSTRQAGVEYSRSFGPYTALKNNRYNICGHNSEIL